MNRASLESLIEFALHLRERECSLGVDALAGERVPQAAKDALELSRIAKRLHYLDERVRNRFVQSQDSGEYDRKVAAALARARAILAPYGYQPYHQETNLSGAPLYAVPPGQQGHDASRDLAVPY